MDQDMLLGPFNRLLADVAGPARVRAAEKGAAIADVWAPLAASGFLDALVPEAAGGGGLALREAAILIEALGHRLVPAPVADTMLARALLAGAGEDCPDGPIVLAVATGGTARGVPLAAVADHALVDDGDRLALVRLGPRSRSATAGSGDLAADVTVTTAGTAIARPRDGLRPLAAVLYAAQMAGAATRLLDMTVAHANERVQFGKPIGKQQAIQQQLAVMAEKTVMLRMAARIGTACDLLPHPQAAAVAKTVASAAAADIAAIAHAVHGAIGISREHDVQLYTRRLHEWRAAQGSEGYWAGRLGAARLASDEAMSADFVRTLYPPA